MINVVIAFDNQNASLGSYFEACQRDIVTLLDEQQHLVKSLSSFTSRQCNAAYIDIHIPLLNHNPFMFVAYSHGANNGLSPLQIDGEVQEVARLKAQDMVNNNYFSHTSPTYGSPFQMLNSFGVSYRAAGENIAANSSNTAAVNAWMNSSGHRANILSSNFNYTGIGVVRDPTYGKKYVQMFIGK